MALQLQQEIDRIEEENRTKELEQKRKQVEHDAAIARKEEEERQRALERASSSSQTPADVAVQQHLGQVLSELYSISGHKSSTDVIQNESDESFDSVVAFIEQISELRLDKDLGKQRLQEIISQQQQQLFEDAETQQVSTVETTENNITGPVDMVNIDSVNTDSVDGDDRDDDIPTDNADEEGGGGNDSDLESNESFHTVDEDNPSESVLIIENEANEISKNIIVLDDSESSDSENDNGNNENNNKNCENVSTLNLENSENIPVIDLENNENIPPVNSENIENVPPVISEVFPRPPLRRSRRIHSK
ncbi:unnamed protein product [Meganyctiphanes norvegica]|uniref:Uncharacterized protein n=1 Tax=Meganyctiphanes norvegica TaxID=48144 RepID=A0AAV2S5F9_MEGNR